MMCTDDSADQVKSATAALTCATKCKLQGSAWSLSLVMSLKSWPMNWQMFAIDARNQL